MVFYFRYNHRSAFMINDFELSLISEPPISDRRWPSPTVWHYVGHWIQNFLPISNSWHQDRQKDVLELGRNVLFTVYAWTQWLCPCVHVYICVRVYVCARVQARAHVPVQCPCPLTMNYEQLTVNDERCNDDRWNSAMVRRCNGATVRRCDGATVHSEKRT